MDANLINALTLFIGIMLTLYLIKPVVLFDEDKRIRQFGVGFNRDKQRKTLFNMTLVVVLAAILSFALNV